MLGVGIGDELKKRVNYLEGKNSYPRKLEGKN